MTPDERADLDRTWDEWKRTLEIREFNQTLAEISRKIPPPPPPLDRPNLLGMYPELLPEPPGLLRLGDRWGDLVVLRSPELLPEPPGLLQRLFAGRKSKRKNDELNERE